MSDISKALESLQEDFDSADKMVDNIYNKYFAKYFKKEVEMYARFKDADVPINDTELAWLITSLPLELFSVSNALTQFKQHLEIVKLKMKQHKAEGIEDEELSTEYKLMTIIYTSVITRVEQEISFSKELIMGAKKIWDARRSSELPPIGESSAKIDLPDYKIGVEAEF